MCSRLNETDVGAGLDSARETEAPLSVHELTQSDEVEVLDFLSPRPIHAVFIKGFIKENGLVNELNRGKFYGSRNSAGQLQGVALLGHITLIEARSDAATEAFARHARGQSVYMILGEQQTVEFFWGFYRTNEDQPHQQQREILFVQHCPPPLLEQIPQIRLATSDDLNLLLPIYGKMHREEGGVNPLDVDPEGFSRRWMRRIGQKQVWVWIEGDKLIFNVDVMCDTPDCVYLEGIYVAPEMRGKGYGLKCMSQLSHTLRARTRSLCLLSRDDNLSAIEFYRKAGFEMAGYYKTIFMPWGKRDA